MIPWPIYTFIFLQLFFVTIGDVKYKKIPNLWSLLNIAIAVILFVLFPDLYIFGLKTFQFSIGFIIVGFMLFQLKIMGGGDSKFLASLFLIIPTANHDNFFYFLLISTIIVGVIAFLRNMVEQRGQLIQSIKLRDIEGVRTVFGSKFAFAIVIMITWFLIGLNNMGLYD